VSPDKGYGTERGVKGVLGETENWNRLERVAQKMMRRAEADRQEVLD
jgi:hypothetical protein